MSLLLCQPRRKGVYGTGSGLCHEAGLVKLGVVALDGTKVAANAALATNRSHQAIEEEVRRMLAEAKAMDAEEDANYGPDRRGDELPEGLGGRTERLKRLKEAKERLQREAEAGAKAVQERVEQRRAEEEATGKKKRGRKPKVVEPLPTEEAKANTTDPDSRIMKTRQGYVQGYNAQAVVREEQIIVAVGVTQEANDAQQLEPMLQTMAHTLEAAGIEERPKAGLADAGYWSEANIRACPWPEMPELLIATTKDWKQRKMLREKGCPRGLDRRQLVLPVATTIFAGRYGVIIRYGGTVDYRPTSQANEAETHGRQDTGNGSGQGWDERAFSAQVAEWPIAVGDESGASVAHPARSLRRGVGG